MLMSLAAAVGSPSLLLKALLVAPMVLMLIARAFVLMTLSLFLDCSSSCVNGTVTDRKRSCGDEVVALGRFEGCGLRSRNST